MIKSVRIPIDLVLLNKVRALPDHAKRLAYQFPDRTALTGHPFTNMVIGLYLEYLPQEKQESLYGNIRIDHLRKLKMQQDAQRWLYMQLSISCWNEILPHHGFVDVLEDNLPLTMVNCFCEKENPVPEITQSKERFLTYYGFNPELIEQTLLTAVTKYRNREWFFVKGERQSPFSEDGMLSVCVNTIGRGLEMQEWWSYYIVIAYAPPEMISEYGNPKALTAEMPEGWS